MRTENGNITINKSGTLLNEVDSDVNYSTTSSIILYSIYGDIAVNEYYQAVSRLIKPGMKVVIEEFLLYASKAKQQINSKMETSKLIGYLQMYCFSHNIPYTMQLAGEVVRRWADNILVHKNVIKQANGKLRNMYYALGRLTNDHERDAMRHAMHYITFKLKKEK